MALIFYIVYRTLFDFVTGLMRKIEHVHVCVSECIGVCVCAFVCVCSYMCVSTVGTTASFSYYLPCSLPLFLPDFSLSLCSDDEFSQNR